MIHAYEVKDYQLHIGEFLQMGKGKHAWKLAKAYCGFDIETTNFTLFLNPFTFSILFIK